MKYLSLGLRALLTFAFVGAAIAKLAGVEMMVQTFETIGVGQWFRYVTAFIEIAGATMLWLPNRQIVGAALLGATMTGAVIAHLFILKTSPAPAAVLGLLAGVVLYIHRSQVHDLKLRN